MKIQVNKYKYVKEVVTTEEFELNEKETTSLKGRSGGDSYVAAIIPNYYIISSSNKRVLNYFTFLSCNREREGRAVLSPQSMSDLNYIESQIKHLPHYEDILNWFKGAGENYACQITDKEYFFNTINQYRVI